MDKLENTLIVLGSAIGIAQLDTILGIIIMSLQIILVLYKLGVKVATKIKDGKYKDLEDDIKDAKDDLDKIRDNLDKEE